MIKKHVFNVVLLLIFTGFSIASKAQAVNKKVLDFLGQEQVNVYSKTEQGRSTLKYLTFVSDSSFYVFSGNLSGKGYPNFSEMVPISSKYTGISGSNQWLSINDFNPLLYDISRDKALCYSLGDGNYLVMRDNNDILKRLYGSSEK